MIQITEDDILGAGKKQVIINNDKIKAIIVPEVGGRIAEIQSNGTQFLYRTYPKGISFGPYTEYGGIEECIGSAPGNLWNASWFYEIKNNGVLLQIMSRSILVRKFITLDESLPIVKIKYDFFNIGNTMTKFTFGIHPEINIGGIFRDNRYYIRSKDGIVQGIGEPAGFKKSVSSPELWCSVSNGKYVFGQMFPKDVIDSIEIYYPRADTHLVIQPMILGVGIAPDMRSSFTYMIYADKGDEKKVEEIRNFLDSEFSVEYKSFSKDEIPEKILKTTETVPRFADRIALPTDFGVEVGHFEDAIKNIRRTTKIPEIPDVNEIIKTNIEKAKIANEIRQFKDAQKQFQNIIANRIEIGHLNGDISMSGWNEEYIGYSINSTVEQENDLVKFKTNGDFSLNIPKNVTDIKLKMVNGHVTIDDISANLSISGVSGKVNAKIGKLAENNLIKISFVNCNINLVIPENSFCTIEASTLGGEVSTNLPIEEEIRMSNYIKGKLGDGTAKILLKTVGGDININGSSDD